MRPHNDAGTLPGLDASTPAVVLKLDPNVLHHGGLGVIRSLGRLGVPVYGVHEGPWAPAASSRYLSGRCFWQPDPDDAGRIQAGLLQLAERIGRPAVLIPTDDAGAIFLAEHGAALRRSFLFPEQPAGLPRQVAGKYTQPYRALQLVKSLVPAYIQIPVEGAPASFWRLLYPMPWRSELERNARLHGLDPYIVAGLVRQESEFNPQAVSPAQAYGLTQILPSTGRLLLKAPRRSFRASVLFRPELNLRLGTTYLRTMYDANMGHWERTLAAYNAGTSRVENWMG